MRIRLTQSDDLPAIQAIFAHEVLTGLATFETVPPTVAAHHDRWDMLRAEGFPHIVAERDGLIAGYALAAPYRPRPAYRHTLENSVYVAKDHRGAGVGRALMDSLIALSSKGRWSQMIAVIGDSNNAASITLHQRCGFSHIGTLKQVGYKFDQWVDTVVMQRSLGDVDNIS